ncbi:MAG: hypothetical protein L6Q63_15210, partial [Giesbergeria sp.]|nr:hypothetical protein [Giesbergeria sp.]
SIPALIKCAISTCVGNALRVLAIPGLHQVLDGGRLSTNTAYYLNSIDASGKSLCTGSAHNKGHPRKLTVPDQGVGQGREHASHPAPQAAVHGHAVPQAAGRLAPPGQWQRLPG